MQIFVSGGLKGGAKLLERCFATTPLCSEKMKEEIKKAQKNRKENPRQGRPPAWLNDKVDEMDDEEVGKTYVKIFYE